MTHRIRSTILCFGIIALLAPCSSHAFGQNPCDTTREKEEEQAAKKREAEERKRAIYENRQQSGQNEPGAARDRERGKKERP